MSDTSASNANNETNIGEEDFLEMDNDKIILEKLKMKVVTCDNLKKQTALKVAEAIELADKLSTALVGVLESAELYSVHQADLTQTVISLRKNQAASDAGKLKNDKNAEQANKDASVAAGAGVESGSKPVVTVPKKNLPRTDYSSALQKGIPKRPVFNSHEFPPFNPRKSSHSTIQRPMNQTGVASPSKVASSGSSSSTKSNKLNVSRTTNADGFTPVKPKNAFRPFTMKPKFQGRVVAASMSPDLGFLGSDAPKTVPDDNTKHQTKAVETNPNLQKEENGTASKPEVSAKGKVNVPVAPQSSQSSVASNTKRKVIKQNSAPPRVNAESAPIGDLANTGGPVAAGTVPSGDGSGTSQSFESTEPKRKESLSKKKELKRQEQEKREDKAKKLAQEAAKKAEEEAENKEAAAQEAEYKKSKAGFNSILRQFLEKEGPLTTEYLEDFSVVDAKQFLLNRIRVHKEHKNAQLAMCAEVMHANMCPLIAAKYQEVSKKTDFPESLVVEKNIINDAFSCSTLIAFSSLMAHQRDQAETCSQYLINNYTNLMDKIRYEQLEIPDGLSNHLFMDIQYHYRSEPEQPQDWVKARRLFVSMASYFHRNEEQDGFLALVAERLAVKEHRVLHFDALILPRLLSKEVKLDTIFRRYIELMVRFSSYTLLTPTVPLTL